MGKYLPWGVAAVLGVLLIYFFLENEKNKKIPKDVESANEMINDLEAQVKAAKEKGAYDLNRCNASVRQLEGNILKLFKQYPGSEKWYNFTFGSAPSPRLFGGIF